MSSSLAASERGFSLVETLVATLLLAVSLVSLAQLFGMATRANVDAKTTTLVTMAAQQKMEQLRSLTWTRDRDGNEVSDFVTDTAVDPSAASGGTGLTSSPSNTLTESVDGYVDYVDANGRILGGGTEPLEGTLYVRRWSIDPLPASPAESLVLQVYAFRIAGRGDTLPDGEPVARFPEEARLTTVKTRKSP